MTIKIICRYPATLSIASNNLSQVEVIVSINDTEVIEGELPNKHQKILLGWVALHQEELKEVCYEIC